MTRRAGGRGESMRVWRGAGDEGFGTVPEVGNRKMLEIVSTREIQDMSKTKQFLDFALIT